MSRKRIWVRVLIFAILVSSLAGCNWFRSETRPMPTKRMVLPSARLAGFFPQVAGSKWTYFGMAEYSHQMTLRSVLRSGGELRLRIDGKVGDPSGGASKRNFNFKLEYLIDRNAVYEQIVTADTPFPHVLKRIRVLALPLRKGNRWTEPVTVKGKTVSLTAEIVSVRTEPTLKKELVRVRYRFPMKAMPNGTYEEVREYLAGVGLYSFEKTFGPKATDRFNYRLRKLEVPGKPVQQF